MYAFCVDTLLAVDPEAHSNACKVKGEILTLPAERKCPFENVICSNLPANVLAVCCNLIVQKQKVYLAFALYISEQCPYITFSFLHFCLSKI